MLELYIENSKVEVSKELEIPLTYKCTELGNPQAVKNEYSKTITIPGTPSNNKLFGHIFRADRVNYLGMSLVGVSFNANKRAKYVILDNGSIFSQGYVKLDTITSNKGTLTYNLTLYGGLGNFFYNLMYDGEDGEERTLNSLYYKLNNLGKSAENTDQLFEYNKSFVSKSWANRINNEVDGNDCSQIFCPIPMYSGYYEDFDVNKCIINKTAYPNALSGSRSSKTVTDGDVTKTYTSKDNWVLCDMNTDVSEWEMNDIRSHYQRLGMRMQTIYDAIKNPDNNGGFIVDDSNVNQTELDYIKNMYLVLNRFNYEEVGQTGQSIELSGWTHDVTNEYNNKLTPTLPKQEATYTINVDTSKWININGQMVIAPEWRIGDKWYKSNPTQESPFATTFVYGYNSKYAAWPWVTDALYTTKGYVTICSCYQYYWVEILDSSNRIINQSPAYMIGMKCFGGEYPAFRTAVNNIRTLMEDEVKRRGHGNGQTVWSYAENEWVWQTGEWPIIDMSWRILQPSKNKSNGMGETGTFTIDLTGILSSSTKKIRLRASTISYVGAAHMYNGSISIDVEKQQSVAWSGAVWRSSFYNWGINNTWYQTQGVYFGIACASFINCNPAYTGNGMSTYPLSELEGKSTGKSKIYAGENAAVDDSHVLSKSNIFAHTKSPYHYLSSLGKMFNWKFEMDRFEDIIHIYSHNRYFKKDIMPISDKLNYETYSIVPTTNEYNIYNFMLEVPEDNYASKIWTSRYSSDYGKIQFGTGYEFNKESKDAIDDVIFSQAVPWKLTSVFFNDEAESSGRKIKPFMGAKYFITLWNNASTDDSDDELETKYNGLLFYGSVSQNKTDILPKLCSFDKEYGNIDSDDLIVLYDSKATNAQPTKKYYISDNVPVISQLNDNNCYVLATDKTITLDIMSRRTGQAALSVNKIPVFGNHFYDSNSKTNYWLNYQVSTADVSFDKTVKNVSLFDLCWYDYVNDLYNQNNKVCNIKYRLNEHPQDAMKHFYTFDNALWSLNEIKDYKPGYAKYTQCNFVKVQDIKSYTI